MAALFCAQISTYLVTERWGHMAHGIDVFSSTAYFLETHANGLSTGVGTGFLWHQQGRYHLVTNWHVLSGRNPETNQCLNNKTAAVPDVVTVYFQSVDIAADPITVSVPLLTDDGEPLWLAHPEHGRAVDIAAIEIDLPDLAIANYVPINEIPEMQLDQRVGMPLFIIGFPFGRQGYGFPVWKGGTFASEPFLVGLSSRVEPIIIDSASRPGMSGSPVIQRVHGELTLADGSFGRSQMDRGGARLVGVYAGRFHTSDKEDAQLGRVWPIKYVRDFFPN
jgi:hypothetical protein